VDVPLDATTEAITRLAEKAWTAALRETDRSARTVVLKLKTSDFRILTRSHTPARAPATLADVQAIALELRQRVELPARVRYRLVGVGLANFRRSDELPPQAGLFGPA
jgi:DNA polymerase IV